MNATTNRHPSGLTQKELADADRMDKVIGWISAFGIAAVLGHDLAVRFGWLTTPWF